MQKYYNNANLVRIIEQLYDKATSAVPENGSDKLQDMRMVQNDSWSKYDLRKYYNNACLVLIIEQLYDKLQVQFRLTAGQENGSDEMQDRRMIPNDNWSRARMVSLTHRLQHLFRL